MSEIENSRRVVIGPHVLERAAARMPDAPTDRGQLIRLIYFQIQDAFREGRTAKREPSWVSEYRRAKKKPHKGFGVHRYVWNAEQTHCFLLMSAPNDGGRSWFVKTVMARKRPTVDDSQLGPPALGDHEDEARRESAYGLEATS